MNGVRIGVDVGGTFTDLVLSDSAFEHMHVHKLLTTPANPERAIVEGIKALIEQANVSPGDVTSVIHGTTLITNTVIERTGAKVGLLATEGFRDSLEMAREIRYDLYDLFISPAPVLVPRERRLGIPGRLDAAGFELEPLDIDSVRSATRELVEKHHIEALAIAFMHAYTNPRHEQAAAHAIRAIYPELPITLSSEVAPEIREFERTSTACANAYVQPLVRHYLNSLVEDLVRIGVDAPLHIMSSAGGIADIEETIRHPIRFIESGPAAGAMAASHIAHLTGENAVLSFDMGGTTAKMCLIENAMPSRAYEFEAGRVRRFKRGSGIPLKISVVDMIEIGAGGGSLAHIDSMGLLKVGPKSAGSTPGPVCYGIGGTQPATTDADVVLGLLNPQYFLGGAMQLQSRDAELAIQSQLGDPLGFDTATTAEGMHHIVNENMAAATRRYMAEKGKDPRDYTLFAFGGAGPVHAYGLAKRLKIKRFVVPASAGVASAVGLLVAPPTVDEVRSYVTPLEGLDFSAITRLHKDMQTAASARLSAIGIDTCYIESQLSADMRYVGQGFEIHVDVPASTLEEQSVDGLRHSFLRQYEELFERRLDDVAIEILSWRLHCRAPSQAPTDAMVSRQRGQVRAPCSRAMHLDGTSLMATVNDRSGLRPGFRQSGPAIIEEVESTTVLGSDASVRVDSHQNLIVDITYDD